MKTERGTKQVEVVQEWLKSRLRWEAEPVPSAKVKRDAADAGISTATLYRAADQIGVLATYVGRNTVWSWTPPQVAQEPVVQRASDIQLKASPIVEI